MARSSELKLNFSEISGENVCVQDGGTKVAWQYLYSGGSVFGAKPMEVGKEYTIHFMEGSCHADIGFTQKDPYAIQNVRSAFDKEQLKMVGSVRVHRKDLQVKVFVKGKKFVCTTPERIRGVLDPTLPTWIYINLKFGNARVRLEDPKTRLSFHEICGENIIFLENEKNVAKLEKKSLASICCIEQALDIGNSVCLRLKPDVSDGTDKPHYYHVYLGISGLSPVELRVISPEMFSVSNKVTSQKASDWRNHVGIIEEFKREGRENTCDGELTVERINEKEIRYTHSATNKVTEIRKTERRYLVFELFRTTMEIVTDSNSSSEGYRFLVPGPHADPDSSNSSKSDKDSQKQPQESSWYSSSGNREGGAEQ